MLVESQANSMIFQDLKLQLTGLYRIKLIFQNSLVSGNFLGKIQNFPGGVGTLKKKRKVTVTVTKILSLLTANRSKLS